MYTRNIRVNMLQIELHAFIDGNYNYKYIIGVYAIFHSISCAQFSNLFAQCMYFFVKSQSGHIYSLAILTDWRCSFLDSVCVRT